MLDSLAALPHVTAFRWLDELPRLADGGRDTTLLVLGPEPRALERMPGHDFTELEDFMRAGGRVVIAFPPSPKRPASRNSDEPEDEDAPPKPAPKRPEAKKSKAKPADERRKKKQEDEARLPEEMRRVDLKTQWAVAFDYAPLTNDQAGTVRPEISPSRAATGRCRFVRDQ